jgi:hypothetical protein
VHTKWTDSSASTGSAPPQLHKALTWSGHPLDRSTRAGTFSAYVDLVRAVESKLLPAGYALVQERDHVLRAIYYGTTWTSDYAVERSLVRNAGFQVYRLHDSRRSMIDSGFWLVRSTAEQPGPGRRPTPRGRWPPEIASDTRRCGTAR